MRDRREQAVNLWNHHVIARSGHKKPKSDHMGTEVVSLRPRVMDLFGSLFLWDPWSVRDILSIAGLNLEITTDSNMLEKERKKMNRLKESHDQQLQSLFLILNWLFL